MKKIKVGVVGLGYWGPNFVRNFVRHKGAEVIWGCDLSKEALDKNKLYYPQIKLTKDYKDILNDDRVDLIAIATPPESHYEIAKNAIEKEKHLLIAKPLTSTSKKATQLIKKAKKKNLLLHGDLTFLYTGAVREMKQLVDKNIIGKPLYFDSNRSNLGLLQENVNVIWDLATHDLSILEYCFGLTPDTVTAVGSKHVANKGEEMAHITLTYSNGFIAHIHVSWLSPVKLRSLLIGGEEKMILYDDLEPHEKIKVYDKGITVPQEEVTTFKPAYRSGDVLIPKLDQEEALFLEIDDLIRQIKNKKKDYTNAQMNLKIIKLLEACDKSLKKGKPVNFR